MFHSHTLFRKLMIPFMVIMLLQGFSFYIGTMHGGTSEILANNADEVLAENVIAKQVYIESKFTNEWTNFTLASNSIDAIYEDVQSKTTEPVYQNSDLQKEVLSASMDSLVAMIRANKVAGAYLIMNDASTLEDAERKYTNAKYGIGIRDYTPEGEYVSNEDLQMIRGQASLGVSAGISLETWWESQYKFGEHDTGDYFYKPLEMALRHPDADPDDLQYFDPIHHLDTNDRKVVSYSKPLMDKNGYPYAILGIELTEDYLETLLDSSNFYANKGGYALVSYQEGSSDYKILVSSGVLFQQAFGSDSTISAKTDKETIIKTNGTLQNIPVTGSYADLVIYNHNTPYENQKVAVLGLVRDSQLYSINHNVQFAIMMLSFGITIVGLILVAIMSHRITNPIIKLSQKIKNSKDDKMPELERLDIDEIDDLVESIEDLSKKVTQNEVRTEFFSRMSHDMRTPMNAIIGFSSPEVIENASEEDLRTSIKNIHTSGDYLLTLINEVLDMTKIESQRMELRYEALDENAVLNDIVPIINELTTEKKIHFIKDISTSSIGFMADRQRLNQIVMNLMSNAVKFTASGGTVKLSFQVQEKEDHINLLIDVVDNGEGMSEEFQKKMYQPFEQEGNRAGGTGLGLAIVKQLVILMNGTIDCVSKEGSGTTFQLVIPCKKAQLVDVTREDVVQQEENDVVDLSNKRVLLCEDHPLNIQVARALLERRGMIVDAAENGQVGLMKYEASSQNYYDIILMDIRMPVMDGLQTAEAIRKLSRPDAKQIPIIAMTANAFKEDVEASIKAGMNEHLSKPIDPKILYLTIEKYLGNH